MNFDRVAPHYPWMERVLAGAAMQRARAAFLGVIPPPHRVLVPGEGHGRFLVEALRRFPAAHFTVLDASRRMLGEARALLARERIGEARTDFIHADVAAWEPPPCAFDLIATNFFFDCFDPAQVDAIVARLATAATPGANWTVADFNPAPAGLARWRVELIVRALYRFFRWSAGVAVRRLAPPDRALARHGFALEARRHFDWQLLRADWWTRRPERAA